MLAELRDRRIDVEALAAKAKLSVRELEDPDSRFPFEDLVRMGGLAARAAGDPAFALHLAEHYRPSSFGVVDYLGRSSGTLGQALQNLCRYNRLLQDAAETVIERRGAAVLVWHPRSDCAHLPEAHHGQAQDVLAALGRQVPALRDAVAKADLTRRSRAWSDRKVTAHHAIVPTPGAPAVSAALSDRERAVYELVGRRYLAQFYPPHEFRQTTVTLEIAGESFTAKGRRVVAVGWKALLGGADEGEPPSADKASPNDAVAPLPPLRVGDAVTALDVRVDDRRTEPPKPFDDASLIAAMSGVARFVQSPAVQKILTETDGLGTPATRAAVIETLFERGYVARIRRAVVSTETGRALIGSLPEVATTPDMTATWEAALRAVADGTQTRQAFLARVGAALEQLVAEGRALGRLPIPAAPPAPEPARRPARRSRGAAPRNLHRGKPTAP